jgi:twitching motility protein PilT
MEVISLLRLAKEAGASDLHLLEASPPTIRVNGSLEPVAGWADLSADDIDAALGQITSAAELARFDASLELDFGFSCDQVGRLRGNAARQRGTTSLVIRLLPAEVPDLDDLGLPNICRQLVDRPRGLVVVSGPTGSGKSTTLAAMLDHLNQKRNRRVVTIEDPVEYIHTSRQCLISQREIGADTTSYAQALRHALRQDPDVIMVGEMRDFETAAAALTVADTGHLVLTTGHAPSAYQAVERVIDLFPPEERNLAQSRLASLLVGVLCQALVPKADGSGRVAAIEILLGNPGVSNLIRDGRTFQLPNLIRTHSQDGMQLLDQALVNHFRSGAISREAMAAFCNEPEQVEKLVGATGSLEPGGMAFAGPSAADGGAAYPR